MDIRRPEIGLSACTMSKHRRAMENRVYRLSAKRVQRLRDSVPVADVTLTDDQLRVRKSKSGLMRQAVDAQAMPAVRKQSFEKNPAPPVTTARPTMFSLSSCRMAARATPAGSRDQTTRPPGRRRPTRRA